MLNPNLKYALNQLTKKRVAPKLRSPFSAISASPVQGKILLDHFLLFLYRLQAVDYGVDYGVVGGWFPESGFGVDGGTIPCTLGLDLLLPIEGLGDRLETFGKESAAEEEKEGDDGKGCEGVVEGKGCSDETTRKGDCSRLSESEWGKVDDGEAEGAVVEEV